MIAEVTRLFHAYEAAFMRNDVAAINGFFWADARTTRYGVADRQLGIDELVAYRLAAPAPAFTRRLENLRISAFGPDAAVAQVEFVPQRHGAARLPEPDLDAPARRLADRRGARQHGSPSTAEVRGRSYHRIHAFPTPPTLLS